MDNNCEIKKSTSEVCTARWVMWVMGFVIGGLIGLAAYTSTAFRSFAEDKDIQVIHKKIEKIRTDRSFKWQDYERRYAVLQVGLAQIKARLDANRAELQEMSSQINFIKQILIQRQNRRK